MESAALKSQPAGHSASAGSLRAVRAVIFDIYGTLLEVGPPAPDADARWAALFEEMLHAPPPLSREAFAARTNAVIARLHAAARARGIPWPEVLWPRVVLEAVPSLASLPPAAFDAFLFRQMQIERALSLRRGAARCLRGLRKRGARLGLASNSQAYTRREMEEHFHAAGLDTGWFEPALCFRSFEHGFSKPDPHVFQWLTTRLQALDIAPEQTLMVGDRLDNDIAPARAFGWCAWHLQAAGSDSVSGGGAGDFDALCAALGLE
jgi:putative hydrolase of the HAD superfamily